MFYNSTVFSPPAHLKSTKSEHILLVRFSCDSVIYITVYIYIMYYLIIVSWFPLKSQLLFSPLGTFLGRELYIHCAFCHHQAIFVGKGLLGGIVLQLPNALALGELFLRFFRSEKKKTSFPKKLTWWSLENNHHVFFKEIHLYSKGGFFPLLCSVFCSDVYDITGSVVFCGLVCFKRFFQAERCLLIVWGMLSQLFSTYLGLHSSGW